MKQITIQKNTETQNSVTNEWIFVRNSSIHNKGVFAVKDIPKGIRIIEYVGRKITKKVADEIADRDLIANKNNKNNGAVYLFTLNKKYDINGNVSWNTARLINHSCSPNCKSDIVNGKVWISAIKDIKKGEELSYDYGYGIENYEDHKCNCGSKNCIGYIVDREQWIKLRKKIRWKKKKMLRDKN